MKPASLFLLAAALSPLAGCNLLGDDCGPFPDTRETFAVSAAAEAPRADSVVVALVPSYLFPVQIPGGIRPVIGAAGEVRLSGNAVRPFRDVPLAARLAVRSDTVFVSVDAAGLVRPACSPADFPATLDVTLALPEGTSVRGIVIVDPSAAPRLKAVSTEDAAPRPFLSA